MKEQIKVHQVMTEKDQKKREKLYDAYVKQLTPRHNCCRNVWRAFLVGGAICLLGQIIQNGIGAMGANKEDASAYTTIILVLLSVLATGMGWYPKLAKFAGAGTVVPITGFANSVAASAIDYKVQGQVFGIGCFIFSIAGPVILYGIFSSWVLGLIYWIYTLFG